MNGIETIRHEELTLVTSYLKAGEFSQLIGLPGVGREALFELLTSNKDIRKLYFGDDEERYHFVLVDFAELRGKQLPDVLKLLFLELSDSLQRREYEEEYAYINDQFAAMLEDSDDTVFLQGMKRCVEYLTKQREIRVSFFLDRFEEYIPSLTDQFFGSLASLRNRSSGKFSVVFALTRPLEHSVEPAYFKDAFELLAGNRVFMKLYDRSLLFKEIGEHKEIVSAKLSANLMQEIVHLTGGHRRMALTAFEEVVRHSIKDSLEDFLKDSLPVRNVSYQIWNSLRPQEQRLLKRQVVKGEEHVFENEDEEKRILYLHDIGLLEKNSFTIPLFESFIHYRVEHHLDEKFQYKSDEKRVFIGEQDITHTFTPSERKALFYFLEHTGDIVSRDELISVVWKESVSTEGVTDQALDQLIYRIRRKIEPDFSNPQYLQTAKGLGFKFSL